MSQDCRGVRAGVTRDGRLQACRSSPGAGTVGSTSTGWILPATLLSPRGGGLLFGPSLALPGKESLSKPGQRHVRGQANDADHHDRRIDIVEIPVTRLLVDEEGDSRHRADHFRDDEVGPCPPEQNAHVGINVRDRSRNDDAPHQAQSARSERLRRLDERRIDLAHGIRYDQHLLEERSDHDDGNLRPVVDAENGDAERAKGGAGK